MFAGCRSLTDHAPQGRPIRTTRHQTNRAFPAAIVDFDNRNLRMSSHVRRAYSRAAERVAFVGLSPLLYRLESSGNSIYNSLQATLKKDISHGFQFLAAYTFAKSIDDAGDSLGAAIGGTFGIPIFGQVVYNDQNNVAAQRGVSDF